MYSVVLLVALTGGEATPAWGKCSGCSGCWGCSGCGGCWSCGGGYGCSGCYGCCGGKHHHRSKGCCGGGFFSRMKHHKSCCGGYGCCGGYSCCGGYAGCHGGYGCSGGYVGCTGGYGCSGGYVGCAGGIGCAGGAGCAGYAAPAVAPVAPGPGPVKPKKTSLDNAAPATIIVTLPAQAKLLVDGNATTSTSERRVFVSPALERGMEYSYTLTAEVVRDGKTETRTEKVAVRAGEETRVNINFPASVASK